MNTCTVQKLATSTWDESSEEKVNQVLQTYDRTKSDLIPLLQDMQRKLDYLPCESLERIAKHIRVPASTVFGVATFYAQFKLIPQGRKVIKVCRGTGCHVRGSSQILTEIEKELEIKAGQTTPDMEYTLETVACFGSCALAPVVVINDRVYGRMTPEKVKNLLAREGDSGMVNTATKEITQPVAKEKVVKGREAIMAVLARAADDSDFLSRLADNPAKALVGYYTLTSEEMAALASGDIQKIESWVGKLDKRHATWLWCRLAQEKW